MLDMLENMASKAAIAERAGQVGEDLLRNGREQRVAYGGEIHVLYAVFRCFPLGSEAHSSAFHAFGAGIVLAPRHSACMGKMP